jgi:hypothetical protein
MGYFHRIGLQPFFVLIQVNVPFAARSIIPC